MPNRTRKRKRHFPYSRKVAERDRESVRDRLEKNAFSDRITASEDLRASLGDARV